jgi:hypothetical protein
MSAVALLTLLSTACTGTGGDQAAPSQESELPPGVSVSVYQTRTDYVPRVLELRITNTGTKSFHLLSARFDSAHFTEPAEADGLVLTQGLTRDLRVHLAEPVCTLGLAGDETVTLAWLGDDGKKASAAVSPTDPTAAIERITGQDCLYAAVDSVVTITPPATLVVEGDGATSVAIIELSLVPTGAAGSITLHSVSETVLLAAMDGPGWPVGVAVDAQSPTRTVPLRMRPARCDPHAIIEDKRGTVLPLAVSTTAGISGTYNLPVSDDLRREIYAWLSSRCGY